MLFFSFWIHQQCEFCLLSYVEVGSCIESNVCCMLPGWRHDLCWITEDRTSRAEVSRGFLMESWNCKTSHEENLMKLWSHQREYDYKSWLGEEKGRHPTPWSLCVVSDQLMSVCVVNIMNCEYLINKWNKMNLFVFVQIRFFSFVYSLVITKLTNLVFFSTQIR